MKFFGAVSDQLRFTAKPVYLVFGERDSEHGEQAYRFSSQWRDPSSVDVMTTMNSCLHRKLGIRQETWDTDVETLRLLSQTNRDDRRESKLFVWVGESNDDGNNEKQQLNQKKRLKKDHIIPGPHQNRDNSNDQKRKIGAMCASFAVCLKISNRASRGGNLRIRHEKGGPHLTRTISDS